MVLDLVVRNATLPDGRTGQDIAVAGGRIVAIEPAIDGEAGETIDAGGHLVAPPFVDCHFHMDATLSLGIPRLNQSGTLLEGIALWGELKPVLTHEAVIERALRYCDLAVSQGLLAVRTHVDEFHVSRKAGIAALIVFCVLLFGLPVFGGGIVAQGIRVFEAFYRSGALVFGGGHVVLPLLQRETVATGWVAPGDFLAGYGAAQAVPGPLFTFAAFLGWMMAEPPHHWSGALLATVGIFLPGLLLVVTALPWWQALRARTAMSATLVGVNAAVVGLLAAALYSPVWTSAVRTQTDFAIACIGFFLLTRWRVPPFCVVVFCVASGVAQSVLW